MKYCNKCRKIYPDDLNYCINCGISLHTNTKNVNTLAKILKQHTMICIMCIVVLASVLGYLIYEQITFNNQQQAILDYKDEQATDKYLNTPTVSDLEIVDGWTWHIDGDYVYIDGSVKNVSEKTINYYEVKVEFIDSLGNVVDSDWTNGDNVSPFASSQFEIMHEYDGSYESVKLSILDAS